MGNTDIEHIFDVAKNMHETPDIIKLLTELGETEIVDEIIEYIKQQDKKISELTSELIDATNKNVKLKAEMRELTIDKVNL